MNISKSFDHNRKTGVVILSLLLFNITFQSQATAETRESLSNLRNDISELQNQDQQATSQLVVTQVFVGDNGDTLVINGVNFDNGDLPVVELGGDDLIVTSSDGQQIIADLPLSFIDSSYMLTVSTGLQRSQFDSFELTLGAVGPQGLQGNVGPRGVPGSQGSPGPQGPVGPASTSRIVASLRTTSIGADRSSTVNTICPFDSQLIGGACGDSGSAGDVRVIYSGPRDGSSSRIWECRVANESLFSSRTINTSAICLSNR